jgi:hypothetical protein
LGGAGLEVHHYEDGDILEDDERWLNRYRILLEQVFDSGLPPRLHTHGDESLSAATFVMPNLNEKKGRLSFKEISCCEFAAVVGQDSMTQYVPYCDCCVEKKLAYRSAQFHSELRGACSEYATGEKSTRCVHTKILEHVIERNGGMQYIINQVHGTVTLYHCCLVHDTVVPLCDHRV